MSLKIWWRDKCVPRSMDECKMWNGNAKWQENCIFCYHFLFLIEKEDDQKLVHSFNVRLEGLKLLMTLCSIIRFPFYLKKNLCHFPWLFLLVCCTQYRKWYKITMWHEMSLNYRCVTHIWDKLKRRRMNKQWQNTMYGKSKRTNKTKK